VGALGILSLHYIQNGPGTCPSSKPLGREAFVPGAQQSDLQAICLCPGAEVKNAQFLLHFLMFSWHGS